MGDTCYSCQYSQGSDQGRACVYDPTEYELGPSTVGCATKPCMIEMQTSLGAHLAIYIKFNLLQQAFQFHSFHFQMERNSPNMLLSFNRNRCRVFFKARV